MTWEVGSLFQYLFNKWWCLLSTRAIKNHYTSTIKETKRRRKISVKGNRSYASALSKISYHWRFNCLFLKDRHWGRYTSGRWYLTTRTKNAPLLCRRWQYITALTKKEAGQRSSLVSPRFLLLYHETDHLIWGWSLLRFLILSIWISLNIWKNAHKQVQTNIPAITVLQHEVRSWLIGRLSIILPLGKH